MCIHGLLFIALNPWWRLVCKERGLFWSVVLGVVEIRLFSSLRYSILMERDGWSPWVGLQIAPSASHHPSIKLIDNFPRSGREAALYIHLDQWRLQRHMSVLKACQGNQAPTPVTPDEAVGMIARPGPYNMMVSSYRDGMAPHQATPNTYCMHQGPTSRGFPSCPWAFTLSWSLLVEFVYFTAQLPTYSPVLT